MPEKKTVSAMHFKHSTTVKSVVSGHPGDQKLVAVIIRQMAI
jgi:hypothetical protein